MKPFIVVALFFPFLLISVGDSGQAKDLLQDNVQIAATNLEVSLVADRKFYKAKDRVELEVRLINNNAVKDIFVYGTLEFGYRGSFMLYRRDAKGREVPTRMIDEAIEPRPKPDDIASFVKLLPFHFLGTTYRSSIRLLNMDRKIQDLG